MEKVKKVLNSINKIAKEDKTLSRLVSQLDIPYGETAGNVISALGYGRKKRAPRKTGGARKRAPRKRGMGAPVDPDALFYSAVGQRQNYPAMAPAMAAAAASRAPTPARTGAIPSSTFTSHRGRGKNGKGFGGFLQKLIQAPLAGLAATSGGLHGALGSFGKKKRGGRKMLGVMPLANLM
jgi:hypothetical protein